MNKRELHKKICNEISTVDTKAGLKKYLGKKLEYEGLIEMHSDTNTLLLDVTLKGKGKIVASHVWGRGMMLFPAGTRISFSGIAGSYTCNKGERKYNIKQIHNIKEI